MKFNNFPLYFILSVTHFPIFISGPNLTGVFDESIIYMIFNFTEKGLLPYKDYIIHYPPGIYIIAKVFYGLNLDIISNPKTFIWSLNLFLQFIIFFLINNNVKLKEKNFLFLYLIIFYNLIFFLLGSEPLTLNLLLISILILLSSKIDIYKFIIILFCLINLILLRYDRFLIGIAIVFLSFFNRSDQNINFFFKNFFLKYVFLVFIPISILILNLFSFDYDIYKILNNIFVSPFNITRESTYFNKLGFGTIILFASIILAFATFIINRISFFELTKNSFFLTAILFIPYSLSYYDLQHIFPIFFFLSLFIISEINKKIIYFKRYKLFSDIVFLICIVFLASKIFQMKLIETDCNEKLDLYINKFEKYKNLYVGSYDTGNSIFNYVYLYLINNKLLPASKIISEEPGIITKCIIQNNQLSSFKLKKSFFLLEDNLLQDKIYNNVCENTKNYYNQNLKHIDYCMINKKKFKILIN